MKTSKFRDAQKAFIIKQGEEGKTVAGIHWPTGECEAITDKQLSDVFQLEEKVRRDAAN